MQMKSCLLLLFLGIVHADECYSKRNLKMCMSYGSTVGLNAKRLCADGARARCTLQRNTTRCPACLPPSVFPNICPRLASVTECTSGEAPAAQANSTSGEVCPSCVPPYKKPACTESKLKECTAKILGNTPPPECMGGEMPQRDSTGCCLTCTPKAARCSETQVKGCRDTYAATIACATDERSSIGSNCCRTCKPTRDVPTRTSTKKCSFAEMKRALKAVPVCEEGEKRITARNVLSCAPSCKRPEADMDVKKVLACVKSLSPCAANSKPVRLPDSRCPVCHPPRPVCNACPAARVCGRVPDANRTLVKKCLRKHQFKIKMRTKDKSLFSGYTPSQMDRALVEFAERYCERNSAADKCDKYLDRIKDSVKCTKLNTFGASTTVTVEIAEDESDDVPAEASTRRLLAEESNPASDLLVEATKDDTDTIVSAEQSSNDVSQNMVSHAMILLLVSISMLVWS